MRKAIAVAAVAATLVAAPSSAQDPHAHDSTVSPPVSQPGAAAPDAGKIDDHMKQMQMLHDRMRSANTQEERQRWAADARNAMQVCMADMHAMIGGPANGARPRTQGERMQSMEKRMDMMQMMMQVMMDQQAMGRAAPPVSDSPK